MVINERKNQKVEKTSLKVVLFAASIALLATPVTGARALDLPSPLVSTQWLADNQDNVRILDVRNDPDSFKDGGHIIGAVRVDFKAMRGMVKDGDIQIEDMALRGDAFQKLMRESGVSNGESVVITHRSRGPDDVGYAAYLYWQLKLHGHDNVAILDGGTTKWIAESREVWGEDESVEPGSFSAANLRDELSSNTDAVKAMIKHKSADIIDARLFEFYIGLEKRPAVLKTGHIPTATSFPFTALLKSDGTFRETDRLASAMNAVGLKQDRPVIAYCNTGHVAAITWFVQHELLGYRSASLYDGSMLAWTTHGNDAVSSISP